MVAMTVELRSVDGTQAAMGWAGQHTIVVDRPDGTAGGQGLGFNGAQLLALAIGGCFCNDLRYVADELTVEIKRIAVSVTIDLDGDPLTATAATMSVQCDLADGSDPSDIIEKATAGCMARNSISKGFPVEIKSL